ncbi:MAG: hypothetical protein LBI27_00510 [Clostridiales bacterium]|jgi:hypothetical protein|nr:hypothetical protein [Clostridiales bacterium]
MRRKIKLAAFTIFAVFAIFAVTVFAQPGAASDPLVTQRFVEDRLAQLQAEIVVLRNAVAALDPNAIQSLPQIPSETPEAPPTTIVTAERDVFEVLHLQEGQMVIFGASAEFILRGGNATAITGVNGIIDITGGRDVLNGEIIDFNHLMMVPVADGRGVLIRAESWIMARGIYTIVS